MQIAEVLSDLTSLRVCVSALSKRSSRILPKND